MCGESIMDGAFTVYQSGSPPHVWGKQTFVWDTYELIGITPTCVGKAKNARGDDGRV